MNDQLTDKHLPKKTLAFLNWFCPDHLIEGILGDLVERYQKDLKKLGKKKADRLFIRNVLLFFHPTIIFKNRINNTMINTGLIKSHLKVSSRSIFNNKTHSFINVAGVSISLAFVFLVFLLIKNELSFDQFHIKKDEIYRVYEKILNSETGQLVSESAVTAVPLAKDLKNELPAIKSFTRLGSGSATVQIDNTPFEEIVSYADSDFFEMFDFPILKGKSGSLLSNPNSVVLSKEIAQKYFGDKNPVGKSVQIDINGASLEAAVSGVFDPKQSSSSIQIDLLTAFENFEHVSSEDIMSSYTVSLVENYIHVDGLSNVEDFEELMTNAIQKYSPADKRKLTLAVQPLSSIHMEDQVLGNAHYISPQKLYLMLGIGLLVLLVATINFVTLSTGQAIGRIKEMGLRKTLGAISGQLRFQLASESFMIVIISLILGVVLSYFAYPLFSFLTGSSFPYLIGFSQLMFLCLIGVAIAIIAGLAQAILIVKYKASEALRGNVFFWKKQ